ncbi:putative reverse transcriptase domain-containing protein [Tanacetum coccineum]|uniref:Reverse transcriptase domain-containing protein n=1 Tax=Tanacetum coccineum TaxID=301880 RepID=A0ABQ5HPW8_9ASTR
MVVVYVMLDPVRMVVWLEKFLGLRRVDVRTYLLGGAIDSSEANGIIRDPKLELESSRFTFDLVPLSYESVDVVVGENWLLRHKAEMVCHEKVVKMPCVPKELVGFTPRRRIGFRMELVQGATPICEGSCRLTSLERQEVWNDCRSCKVRVGSNGNLLWEASVLLGRKKGGVHGDDVAKTVFRMRNRHVEVYGYAFWVNQCTSDFHGVNEPGGVRVTREDDRGVTEGREDVRKVFQQRGSGAKRKLSRCGRNQMGNEPILALPEGADNFVVYYDARSKDLEACLEKGRSSFLMSCEIGLLNALYTNLKDLTYFLNESEVQLVDVFFSFGVVVLLFCTLVGNGEFVERRDRGFKRGLSVLSCSGR